MKDVIALLLVLGFALPATATECYGTPEKKLARELLATVPFLGMSLERQKDVARRVRNETCTTIALAGRIVDLDYAHPFFGNSKNRAIVAASEARGLDPLRVQAALVDAYWPPKAA